MIDIFHKWGNDLAIGSGGDLALSTGSDAVSQRVFRRLLTNPGDYLWNLDYGAGLAQFVGSPCNPTGIEAIVRTQLALESVIPVTPAPQVAVRVADAATGHFIASITYADPSTLEPVQLNIPAG